MITYYRREFPALIPADHNLPEPFGVPIQLFGNVVPLMGLGSDTKVASKFNMICPDVSRNSYTAVDRVFLQFTIYNK
jgi:hypothetical protein